VEACGQNVGISEHCGYALTWNILSIDTNKVIKHSVLRPADKDDRNLRAELLCGEDDNVPILHSRQGDDAFQNAYHPNTSPPDHPTTTLLMDVEDLIGRSFCWISRKMARDLEHETSN
jgi:hypothetical protein